jgi:hypothetical protein
MPNTTTVATATITVSVLADVRAKFILYASIPFIIVNLIGNILNTIVFMKKKFSSTSSGFYFAVLSIVDIFQSYLVIVVFLQQFDIKIENTSSFMCKLHKYLNVTFPMFPSWILVLIALDRFILSTFIQAGNMLKNKKNQIIASLTFIIIVSSINTSNFRFFDLYPIKVNSTSLICMSQPEYLDFTTKFNIYNCFLGTSFLPFGIMTFANMLTIRKIVSSKKQAMKKYTNLTKEIHFATTIFTMNIVFLVAYFPTCVTRVLVLLEPNYPNLKKNHDLLSLIMNFFIYTRHAHSTFQIFIYIFINRIFRHELIKLVVGYVPCMQFLTQFTILTNSTETKSKTTEKVDSIAKIMLKN